MLTTAGEADRTHSDRHAALEGAVMDTFLVTIEFESTGVDADGNAYVRTGSVDVVEQAAHPRAAEEQARAAFAATSKGAIITVSVRAQRPHP